MFRQNHNKFLELIFMDNTTRDHLIKLMKQKIESEMVDSLNGLEDYEKLGERITSALKEKFAKNNAEEEDNGALFDDDDDEFNEFEETDLTNEETEEEADGVEEKEEEKDISMERSESQVPPIIEDIAKEQPPTDEVTQEKLSAVTGETEVVDRKEASSETTDKKQEVPELKLADEPKSPIEELEMASKEKEKVEVLTNNKDQAVDKLQKQFEREFEILQTIHKLERWEIAKRHRRLEEDFIEEFEKKLKEIQDSF